MACVSRSILIFATLVFLATAQVFADQSAQLAELQAEVDNTRQLVATLEQIVKGGAAHAESAGFTAPPSIRTLLPCTRGEKRTGSAMLARTARARSPCRCSMSPLPSTARYTGATAP